MDVTETRAWRIAAKAAREQSNEQRKLVLRYPDIAARLCQPPLKFTKPEQWTGYVPPAREPESEMGAVPLNTSPFRAALMDILEAAAERADSEQGAA